MLLHCSSLDQETGYSYAAFFHQFVPDTSGLHEDVIVYFVRINEALILQGTYFTGLQWY